MVMRSRARRRQRSCAWSSRLRKRYGAPGRSGAPDANRESLTRLFARILLVGKLVEFHVVQAAAGLLDLADVNRLHDIARFRIDHDRAARTGELYALECRHDLVAVGRAVR